MKLFDLIDQRLFNEMRADGMIDYTKHPDFDLWILNYSKECQFAKMWNDATETCRGLIVDKDNNIIARPFRKFYNYEELVLMNKENEIPNCGFKAYEKLDGSLGIMYFGPDGNPYVATRGSFTSEQAKHATKVIQKRYAKFKNVWNLVDKSKTYLFEIIYPEDLHVVTYKDVDDVFLLAVIDTETGEEDDIMNWSHVFNTTNVYDGVTDYLQIREMFSGDNKEGFVIKFDNGFRMKLKYAEYWKLHFLKAGFTEKAIFGYIASGDNEAIHEAMSMFDEEHQIYYNNIIDKIMDVNNEIREIVSSEWKFDFETRKDAAEYYKTCTYPGMMFLLYGEPTIAKINEAFWDLTSKKLYGKGWNLKTYLENKNKDKFYTNNDCYLD